MSKFDIVCRGCGSTGSVNRVTASLKCARCGHGDDLDLLDPREAASPGTGWGTPRPNVLEGWDEYTGPVPHTNPLTQNQMDADSEAYNDGDWAVTHGNPGYLPGGGYSPSSPGHHIGPTTGVPPIEQDDEHKGPASGGARWQGKQSSWAPLHVTLPDGTQWEGAGRVVASAPAKKTANPLSRVAQVANLIREKNPGLSEGEITALARLAAKRFQTS